MVLLFDEEYESTMFDMGRSSGFGSRPRPEFIGFEDPFNPDWGGPTPFSFDTGPRRMSGPASAPVLEEHPDYFNPDWGGGGYARPDDSFGFDVLPGWAPSAPEFRGFPGWEDAEYEGFDAPPTPQFAGDEFRLGFDGLDAFGQQVDEQHQRNFRDTWEIEGRPNWDPEAEERNRRETWEIEGRPDEAEAIRNWLRQREGPDTLRMGRRLEEMSLAELRQSFEEESTYQDKAFWEEPEIATMLSGEKTLGALGIDSSGLPDEWYLPLRQAVDVAAAPATWATIGMGSSVPIVGSAFGGRLAGRAAGEIALGTGSVVAGQGAMEGLERYSGTGLPGSGIAGNPWVQAGAGLGAGVLAAGAGIGAVKNADAIARGNAAMNRGIARVQGYPEPVFGGSIIDTSGRGIEGARGVDAPLARGEVILDRTTGKQVEVARKFSGTDQGWVQVKDPETGELVKRRRWLLGESEESTIPGVAADEAAGQGIEAAGASRFKPLPPETPFRRVPQVDAVQDVVALQREFQGSGQGLFVRWSGGSDKDFVMGGRSKNTASRPFEEEGLSAWHLGDDPDQMRRALLEYKLASPGRKPYLLTGDVLATGADGEPIIGNFRPVARLSTKLIAQLQQQTDDLTAQGRALRQRIHAADEALGAPRTRLWSARWAEGEIERGASAQTIDKLEAIARELEAEAGIRSPDPGPTGQGAQSLRAAPSADGSEVVTPPVGLKAPRLPRTADGDLVPPGEPPLRPTGDMDFRQAIMSHLKGEWYYRISGTAKQELKAGRSRQASGIVAGSIGETGTDAIANMRAGARGKILSQREPLSLTEAQVNQANTAIVDAMRAGTVSPFEVLQADDALKAMLAGDRPQPAQMRIIRRVFGDDMADLVVKASEGKTSYDFYRGATREAVATAENFERTLKREATRRATVVRKAEQAHYDALNKALVESDPGMPTPGLGKRVPTDPEIRAKQRGMDELDRAIKASVKAQADAFQAELDAASELLASIDPGSPTPRSIKAATYGPQRPPKKPPITAAKEAAALDRGIKRLDVELAKRDAAKILDKAVSDGEIDAAGRVVADDVVKVWSDANRVMLDTIGEAGTGRLRTLARNIRAGAEGNVGDSYVTMLAKQREILRGALEQTGVAPDLASKVVAFMVDQELARRYHGQTPERVTSLVAKTKNPPPTSAGNKMLAGAGSYTQQWKNTAFGLMDMGVIGIQGLKALGTDNVPLLLGAVNRAAGLVHLAHVDTTAGSTIGRRAQYALDGVAGHNVSTGVSDVSQEGTMLRWAGKPGQFIDDHTLRPLIDINNRFQFGFVMGNLRDMAYEGRLVLAKASGADIADPMTRRVAAGGANAATSAGQLAVSGKRRLAEQSLLMTPSMRRAQIQQVTQVVKGFTKPRNRAEFINSAAALASVGVTYLVIDKVLNDMYGVEPFEWDISKPGFGRMTAGINGKNYSIDLMPQEQVWKYTGQAIRALAEAEPGETARAMAKLGISSSGPVLQVAEKMAGYGFDPTSGSYAMGDWGDGMSPMQRVINGLLPVTPMMGNLINGKDTVENIGGVIGANVSEEHAWTARDRQIAEDPELAQYRKPGTDPKLPLIYENLSPRGAQLAREKYGTPESPNDTLQANRDAKAEIEKFRLEEEKAASQALLASGDGVAFREAVSEIQEEAGIRKAQVDENFQAFKETGILPTDPSDRALTQFYALYELPGMRKPGGEIDWERFEEEESKLRASWTDEQRQYVDTQRTETAHEPAVQAYYAAKDALDEAGWFELKDEAWEAYKKSKGNAAAGIGGYWEWRDDSVQEEYDKLMAGGFDPLGARQEAERVVAGYNTIAKFNEFFRTEVRHDWVEKNEALARQAIHYGYFEPDKAERKWLEDQWKKANPR